MECNVWTNCVWDDAGSPFSITRHLHAIKTVLHLGDMYLAVYPHYGFHRHMEHVYNNTPTQEWILWSLHKVYGKFGVSFEPSMLAYQKDVSNPWLAVHTINLWYANRLYKVLSSTWPSKNVIEIEYSNAWFDNVTVGTSAWNEIIVVLAHTWDV